jgi:hypothetical protein
MIYYEMYLYILFFSLVYVLISFEEWFLHKYFMHKQVNIPWVNTFYSSHLAHHIHTSMTDFSLQGPEEETVRVFSVNCWDTLQ